MSHRSQFPSGRRELFGTIAVAVVMLAGSAVGRAQQPPAFQRLAPIDLTGTWVSVVTEDWHLRMFAPEQGDFEGLPVNEAGKKALMAWDRARETDACKAYGAPAIMRIPGRVKVSWRDAATLQLDLDAGRQTRLLHFNGTAPRGAAPGWQGHSVASWSYGRGFNPLLPPAPNVTPEEQARRAGGTLKVVTTNLRPGYIRKNGMPYSAEATLTEYFELLPDPQGTLWFVVTSVLHDPTYLLKDFITSSNFKKEPDARQWRPAPCDLD